MQRFLKFTLILFTLIIVPISSLTASDFAGEINGLQIKEANGDLRVEISNVGNIDFNLFFVKDPERLVVDCIGAENHLNKSLYETKSPLIYRLRASQFKRGPEPISRLVLDLRKKVNHRIFKDQDKQVLIISDSNGMEKTWGNVAPAAIGYYMPFLKDLERKNESRGADGASDNADEANNTP